MVKKLSKFLIGATLIMMGCTIEYEDNSDNINKSDEIPDSVMTNFSLTQMRDNKPYTIVTSSIVEVYDSKNKTILKDVNFTEFNTSEDRVATIGKADTIEFYNDTEDAKIEGSLSFISKENEIEMVGEYLYWNKENKKISSNNDSKISVVKDDGSQIEGYGFSADLKHSTFSFEKDVSGVTN